MTTEALQRAISADLALVVLRRQSPLRRGSGAGILARYTDKSNERNRLVRIFRIAIPASDIDRSRLFYERVLALTADDTVPSRLYFHCGDVILALIDWRVEGQGPLRPTPDDMYLATGELESVYERALAAGAREVSSVEQRPWGERSFYCLDPDGNRLCFVDDSTLFLGRGATWT